MTDIHDDMLLYVTYTNSSGEDRILSSGNVLSSSDSIIIPMGQTLQKYQSGIIEMYDILKLKTNGNHYTVDAIAETISRTNLADLKIGDSVNLERSMPVNSRFDGHVVQGHIDEVGICKNITESEGSWVFELEHSGKNITVEKGSITVNGVSLTVVESKEKLVSVAIIPHTFHNTNFCELQVGSKVNLEFDILGKYISKLIKNNKL